MSDQIKHLEVRWKNFKSFEDTNWVKIKPVTILLGSNNTGKTNFIAPFLLMNQTINSRDNYSPMILKGCVYDGGSYVELAKNYDEKNDISFGFKYDISSSKKNLEDIGAYPPGGFEVTLGLDSQTKELCLKQKSIFDIYNRRFFNLRKKENKSYSYTCSGIGSKTIKKIEREAITNTSPSNFLFTPNTVLAEHERIKKNKKGKMKSWDFSKGFVRFLSVISYNLSKIDTYFGDLSFIGPIREYPHRIYEITNETINTVGPMGENTPNLLKKNKDNEKLNYWIKKFGFGDRLIFKQQFSNTYTIRFENNNSDKYTSIANAGFGASQVLPLIVQSLISPKNTITIAEQPEIHLNPRIQCELADLFVEMGNNGQTIIVETHSEHLLLRLRRLIAEKKIDSDKVALYFIENNAGNSTIKNINILQNGNIDGKDWPKGFFADSLKESIALATAQSKNFNKKTTEKIND